MLTLKHNEDEQSLYLVSGDGDSKRLDNTLVEDRLNVLERHTFYKESILFNPPTEYVYYFAGNNASNWPSGIAQIEAWLTHRQASRWTMGEYLPDNYTSNLRTFYHKWNLSEDLVTRSKNRVMAVSFKFKNMQTNPSQARLYYTKNGVEHMVQFSLLHGEHVYEFLLDNLSNPNIYTVTMATGVKYSLMEMRLDYVGSGIGLSGDMRPSRPFVGTIFFDTTINKLIVYNGTEWTDTNGNTI